VFVEDDLYEYATRLSDFTRHDSRVLLGASPRATLSLIQAGKAAAVLAGRAYVVPDDLRALACPVLAHRLVLIDDVDGDITAREAVIEMAVERVSYRKAVRPA
jgi:MoxR-like ATPase